MKHLFAVLLLLFVQKLEALDRWLCTETPWYISLPWCALWVRKDPFHPSLDRDYYALVLKKRFHTKLLLRKLERKRSTHRKLASQEELRKEGWKVVELEKRIQKEYDDDLGRRREIARKRDLENQLPQNPSQ